ncbi:MAG: site-specific integrase [Candidatus Melainabacteria bacterium]|nr:MAG: site-specific integrase [Candidatus Melainabacteria bacterium]
MANGQIKCDEQAKNMRLSGQIEMRFTGQIHANTQEWLDERRQKFPGSGDEAFFLSNRCSRLSVDSIDHAIRSLAQSANIEGVSAHTLRHTCLTNLVRNGVDVVLVAQVGGHKKLETTMRYSLPTHADQAEALENLPVDS